MRQSVVSLGLVLVLLAASLHAQEGPRRGTIKEVADNRITITADGKDIACTVTKDTRLMSVANQPIEPPLQAAGVKAGADVTFLAREQDGQHVLIGLKLTGAPERRESDRKDGPLNERGGIRRGKLAKLDLDGRIISIATNDGTETFPLTADAIVLGASGQTLQERFAGIKDGADVFFKVAQRDGKSVVVAVKPAEGEARTRPAPTRPAVDASQLVPLTLLGTEKYHDFAGGLYPQGQNERPAAHEAAGLSLAKQIQPLNRDGQPDPDGAIVLLSVGMSNTSQISQGFQQALRGAEGVNPRVVFINGAQGGMTAAAIQDPDDNGRGTQYWRVVDERLRAAGLSRAQVQAVWIKQADAGPTQGFPAYAQQLQAELTRIVQLLPERFPNIRQVYLSGRTYGGFAKTSLNPEPYAYESGFSVKWLIEQQLAGDTSLNFDAARGDVTAPWLSWGPYLWDNGVTPRVDGYRPVESDFAGDGTHHAGAGVEKLGTLLLRFFETDSTTRPWFVRP